MKTKPRGDWANFRTECECGAEITVNAGRIESHQCERPISLAELRAALESRT